jgi:hypothetical protein
MGSKAYGVDNENSDEDIGVVLDGYSGMDHIVDYETKNEYFIFSKDLWIKKMEFDASLANLFLIFPDEVIGNSPLYIKEEFITTYESYQTRDFASIFKTYLGKVIDYFETYLNEDRQTKTMWHLYRIEEQMLRFVSTGEWSLILTPGTIEKIQVYKQNYKLQNEHSLSEFKNIIQYLKEVKNHE